GRDEDKPTAQARHTDQSQANLINLEEASTTMEQRGASRSTLNTQMNLWMVLSLLAALAAIFGLGSWTIFRIAPDFATAPQDASLSLWIATVVAALGAVIVIAFSWLRMRAGLRQRMLELAE